jgi:poly(3-hydroxybutyrate) depolymerase
MNYYTSRPRFTWQVQSAQVLRRRDDKLIHNPVARLRDGPIVEALVDFHGSGGLGQNSQPGEIQKRLAEAVNRQPKACRRAEDPR